MATGNPLNTKWIIFTVNGNGNKNASGPDDENFLSIPNPKSQY